jgi:hypothetical protein
MQYVAGHVAPPPRCSFAASPPRNSVVHTRICPRYRIKMYIVATAQQQQQYTQHTTQQRALAGATRGPGPVVGGVAPVVGGVRRRARSQMPKFSESNWQCHYCHCHSMRHGRYGMWHVPPPAASGTGDGDQRQLVVGW